MYLSNTGHLLSSGRAGGFAEQAAEHGMLTPNLLDAVDRQGILNVSIAFVLAREVTVKTTLDQHRDDLFVGNAVFRPVVQHLVELGVDVEDVRHELEQPL